MGMGLWFPTISIFDKSHVQRIRFPPVAGQMSPQWVMGFGHNIKFIRTLVSFVSGKAQGGGLLLK
jgi:hypothetical protein